MDKNASERSCPDCGSTRQALIVYGLVESTPELRARLAEGSIVLGGSCVTGEDPEWYCLACRGRWGLSRQTRRWVEREEPVPRTPEWLRFARHLLLLAVGYGTVLAIDHWVARWLAVLVGFAWFGPFLILAAGKHFIVILLSTVAAQALPRGEWPSASCVWFIVSSFVEFAGLLCCLCALASRLLG